MTTEIERYEPNAVASRTTLDLTPIQVASDFHSWAPKLQAASAIAREIAQTDFVPGALRGNTAAVTAAILAGSEMGIGPMASLMHVHVIDGRPALSAEMARALVLGLGHTIRYREMSTTRCVVEGRRRGEQDWTTVTWTMDDAKRANLDGRTNWRRYPRRMLAARGTGELCRLLFSDALAGMPYVSEELEDDSDDVAATVDATGGGEQPAKRTAQRRTAQRGKPAAKPQNAAQPSPSAGPPLPGEPGYDTPTEDAEPEPEATPDTKENTKGSGKAKPDAITRAQQEKLHALLTQFTIHQREDKLEVVGILIGRAISSSNDLTKQEASTAIDTLERLATADDPVRALDHVITEASTRDNSDTEQPDTQPGEQQTLGGTDG